MALSHPNCLPSLLDAGRISFLEFLLCLEGWVIDAEDSEDILAS
jgi:hypothetical protein